MKKGLLLLLSILTLSCNSDDTDTRNQSDIDIVTGITFRQNFDDAPFQVGNPNVLVNNKFVVYPNPAIVSANIIADGNVTDVWIVAADPTKNYQDVNFSNILNSDLYSEQSIGSHAILTPIIEPSTDYIALDLETLSPGYYRVFVKIDGEIYWDNLYKTDSEQDGEEQINAIIEYWNFTD